MAYAFCTLLTSDSYLPGVLTLAHALRLLHPKHTHPVPFKLVCLATPETVSDRSLRLAAEAWDLVAGVEVLEWDGQADRLELLGRHDLALVLTKLHAFRLTDFTKVVFLDADTLPLKPLSHLFALPYEFAAAPDTGWPDCFNSGVMVLTPSDATFDGVRALMGGAEGGSFDGGDQGVLNQYFDGADGRPSWHRLSFAYNVTPTAAYTYAPAYTHYGRQISVVHFIGKVKPWNAFAGGQTTRPHTDGNRFDDPAKPFDYDGLIGRWWSVYNRSVAPRLRVDGGAVGRNEGPLERLAGGIAAHDRGYVGLPLEGRDDLVRPSQRPPPPPPDAPASAPAAPEPAAEPDRPASPPPRPPTPEELQKGVPYYLPWDPATQDPPKTGAQMSGVFPVDSYGADWAAQAAREPSGGAREWVPDVPEHLRGGRKPREDGPAAEVEHVVPAVFPWEDRPRPPPARVFPGEPRQRRSAQTPVSIKVEEPQSDLPPKRRAPPPPPPPQQQPIVKQSFAEAMAGPTRNAWDSDPAIQAYASRLTSPPSRAARAGGPAGASSSSRGGRPAVSETNRSREQSRDGGADGDDEESAGEETDDEAEGDDEGGGVHGDGYRKNGPGGGAGGASGGGGGGGGARSAGLGGHAATGGTHVQGHQHHQHQQHHQHHAHHHHQHGQHLSRAVQTSSPSVRSVGIQHSPSVRSPVLRSTPLPSQPLQALAQPQQQQLPVPASPPSGQSTPPLESLPPTSAENSALPTPSRLSVAGSPPAVTKPAAHQHQPGGAFNTHFEFDLKRKSHGGQTKKIGGRTWDPEREVDAFRDQTRRFLGAY